ncbi:hypothetical protein CFC21_031527 [Triticum aestivum]|uniref:F-box domain-containing protein n=3 Tax=Triticinae TaxID=1648030 RepID=A0A9R1JID3_WHEAT|nr:hypothetical protein CFC21_031527 [Triticum aestivum]
MHDDETATTKTKANILYLPDELVSEILPRLPVESLLRFRSVCKVWRGIIDKNSFLRQHLRLQTSSLLVAPWIRENDNDRPLASSTGELTAAGLYLWDGKQQSVGTLLHAVSDYRFKKAALHRMAHCDGLVLLPTDNTVHVVNPATRRSITLPPTPNAVGLVNRFQGPHAFGLGHDPRSNAYKVAHFYGYLDMDMRTPGSYYYTAKMGVFTIGTDSCWRDTAAAPPHHHVIPQRTATFSKGSLFWTVEEGVLHDTPVAPGFVRYRLEDESFSIVSAPPCTPRLNYEASSLTDLHGELCVCVPRSGFDVLEMWMSGDLDYGSDPPHWDLCRVINGPFPFGSYMPVIATADAVVFQFAKYYLYKSDLQSPKFNWNKLIEMKRLRYHHLDTDTFVKYARKIIADLYVIPYVPSLVPI